MTQFSRRRFLTSTAALLAAPLMGKAFYRQPVKPLLSFSTLGCPDWTFAQITDFAAKHGFKALEIRGIQRQMDLAQCPEFSSKRKRRATQSMMKDKGLRFINLGSSANLHTVEPAERKKQLDDAKRFIDLAEQIDCPYIRVFPNNLPKNQDKAATLDLIAQGLTELGNHAKGSNVTVLMETHGDVVLCADLQQIMQQAAATNTGLIWDITNMWTITKEAPAVVYEKLKPYIKHTHIKDARLVNGKVEYRFLGQGEVPIFEAIDLLAKDGYSGYYSFEWEKLWHPELAEPELAIADYAKTMTAHFEQNMNGAS
ncbi:sugar phosphate isomerase/epimerase family protein [Foetidibacter luteolus]|uniref:sugar phosphate isomerase/epimerase family protein n=1 Tax=Foetidibacter luteolus TaxID=2608880 RepID=UPI00129BD8C6|nr:sugar phosphate isomerase/epimerase family protein [Foetidibacter luteolus]